MQGTFNAKFIGYDIGYSKHKGTETVVCKLQIVGHPEYDGRVLVWRGYMTDKTAKRTLEALRYGGWKGSELYGDLMADGLGSQLVQIVVEQETYEGKTRAVVRWVNRFDDGSVRLGDSAMTNDQRQNFHAKWRSLVADVPPVDGPSVDDPPPATPEAASRPGQPEMPPPPTDDDIPF